MDWKFKFECGCIFPRKECKQKWIPKIKEKHYICPKHPDKFMVIRIATCGYCSKEFETSTIGRVPENCPQHQKIRKSNTSKTNIGVLPLTNKHIQANMERNDCKFRRTCLDTFTTKQFLPCLNCEKYIPYSSN